MNANPTPSCDNDAKRTAWDFLRRLEEVLGPNFILIEPEPACSIFEGPLCINPQDAG